MKLCDAPVGLFLFKDTLCLMTEYSSLGCGRHAYIVSSGEMFWGGAKSKEERANLDVTPVTVRPGGLRPNGRWIIIDDDYGWDDEQDDEMHVILEVECSDCGCRTKFRPAVEWGEVPDECPNCGAKMDGDG